MGVPAPLPVTVLPMKHELLTLKTAGAARAIWTSSAPPTLTEAVLTVLPLKVVPLIVRPSPPAVPSARYHSPEPPAPFVELLLMVELVTVTLPPANAMPP